MTPLDVVIETDEWAQLVCDAAALARRCQSATSLVAPDVARGACVLLTSDERLAALNSAFRGRNGATDVLSFPSGLEPPESLGDIAIASGVVAADARAAGISFEAHLAHMIVHGLLHLAGYDHENESEALEMEAIEISVLKRLGYEDPYLTDQHSRQAQASICAKDVKSLP